MHFMQLFDFLNMWRLYSSDAIQFYLTIFLTKTTNKTLSVLMEFFQFLFCLISVRCNNLMVLYLNGITGAYVVPMKMYWEGGYHGL